MLDQARRIPTGNATREPTREAEEEQLERLRMHAQEAAAKASAAEVLAEA
jgi:hypothetical protein